MDVWADHAPLYIWSGGERADLTPVKEAKAALAIEKSVAPVGLNAAGYTQDGAPVSLFARVLAIGSRPPFLCEHALVTERTSSEGYQRALSWVLGVTEFDPKANTVLDAMVAVFGPETREISEEELEAERKMDAYLEGRG